ncbi:CD3072 family TudS-related putative desulfidase [Pseudanabaena mucicola]|uniref:DUF523 domain-containing protein n=1 Tax=Pseudanabaena mucicola FACHB-723 TaxID=2692860 RepID=A0ABR7ZVR7_9CYAN|nr:CD3072 family TudS-related putative desulfidase [Pseudanabaena mucicola]MBD2188028.1 hypothetical protein [Pseudanabaena mucicola FACHB-723]
MSDRLGKIKNTVEDARSGRLIFVSHCILNQNACVRGIASQPAAIRELVDLILDNDVSIYQMPCPEVTFCGSMRWGQVKKQYSSPMFRRHCRQLAEQMCDQAQTYQDNDHEVLGFVMRDGSPTCGLLTAAVEADDNQIWGGMVWEASPLQRFAATKGVFTEELHAELQRRNMTNIPLLSLPEVEEAGSIQECMAEIEKAITKTAVKPLAKV